jgi:hypothetical protein
MSKHLKPRRRIDKFRLDEQSTVYNPAHTPAKIAIMKRAADTGEMFQKKMALTTMSAGHAHSIIMVQADSQNLAELRAGRTSWSEDHTHDWIMDDAGNIILADSEGHTHGLAALVLKNEETLDAGVLAALDQNTNPASTTKSAADRGSENPQMTPEEQAAIAKAADEKLNIEKARADRAESIVSLSPDQRSHYDTLDGAGQEAFLGDENKDAIVKNAANSDPVVFEDAEAGIVLRKSAGEAMVALAKQAQTSRNELTAERALRKNSELTKRAGALLKNCAGTEGVKGALLGAVEGIGDETLRKGALEILTAKDLGIAKTLETLGDGADSNELPEAGAKLNELAKAHAAKTPGMTFAKAYTEVLFTDEGQKLHAQL